ncbi:MAG: S23 ribosomal protein [Candidatus Levybacteria bacterium GW2011_GWA2_40_8]|nr:MAG: S23 ribosomal protein [Candidatus Levybacteria bacterium GW2011_GWA2_40_8]
MARNEEFVNRALRFAVDIISFTKTLPKERAFWVITDQLIRSGCSIGANMTEAFTASTKKDYINFYSYSLKSANETIYWLRLIQELIPKHKTVSRLMKEVEELCRILAASIITMKRNSK